MFPMLHGVASQQESAFPLDSFANVAAVFSVRRLLKSYTGPLVGLRRDSDNAELDFGATAAGDLDTAAITAWLGGANGFIHTWYDQSGAGVNWVQTTAANQPPYATNQTNGKPAFTFTAASSHFMTRGTSSFLPAGSMTAYVAMQKATEHSGNVLYDVQASGNRFLLSVAVTQMETRVFRGAAFYAGNGKILVANAWHIMGVVVDSGATTDVIYRDGTAGTTSSNVGFLGTLGCRLGCTTNNDAFLNGAVAECLIFTAAHNDATRDALEADLGAYYGITVV